MQSLSTVLASGWAGSSPARGCRIRCRSCGWRPLRPSSAPDRARAENLSPRPVDLTWLRRIPSSYSILELCGREVDVEGVHEVDVEVDNLVDYILGAHLLNLCGRVLDAVNLLH
eukprot:2502206-Heterocapsa_arctica.AAC.1